MSDRKVTRSSPVLGSLARWVVVGSSKLPIRWAQGLGALLGGLLWLLPNRLRRTSEENVARCLPELSRAEQRRLVRRSLIESGKNVAEAGALWRWPPERLAGLEAGVDGEALLDRAVASDRGTLLLLPHVGNWEVFNHFLMARHPFTALYRPPRIAELDRVIRRARERTGCTMAPATRAGLRRLHGALAAGGLVLVLPDQEPLKRHGIFAPFFGVPALTMTLVPRLVRKLSPEVLYGYARRLADGRFRICLRRPPGGLDGGDLATATARMNDGVEACVRECPEQYTWSYRRFRTRPPEELARLRLG